MPLPSIPPTSRPSTRRPLHSLLLAIRRRVIPLFIRETFWLLRLTLTRFRTKPVLKSSATQSMREPAIRARRCCSPATSTSTMRSGRRSASPERPSRARSTDRTIRFLTSRSTSPQRAMSDCSDTRPRPAYSKTLLSRMPTSRAISTWAQSPVHPTTQVMRTSR